MSKPGEQLYTFEWLEGGYNSVEAVSLIEAIELGNATGRRVVCGLHVDPDKIWLDVDGSVRERYRKQYEGMDV